MGKVFAHGKSQQKSSKHEASMVENKKIVGNKLGKKIWFNGELKPSDSVNIGITAHSLHYGLAAFEGIRAYEQQSGKLGIFRCEDHMLRFIQSCHTGLLPLQYSLAELVEACRLTVKNAELGACYLRPIGFLDAGPLGVYFDPDSHPFSVAIIAMNWGKYLGADAMKKGSRLKISSFTRHHPNISMTKAKFTGNYINGVLAKLEARKMGFDEALMLDPEGYLAEGTGENVFLVSRGKVFTPSVETVLAGITRDTVVHILNDMKMPIVERRITRDELYNADEVFLSGTAAEITPVAEVDMRRIGAGKPGPITLEVQRRFFDIVTGNAPQYKSWITAV